VSSHPQKNVDFYQSVLGLRLVKTTVHFDNADVYHLYYGDEIGTPGTLITFFPFPNEHKRGKHGSGSVSAIQFAIPDDAAGYWHDRLRALGVHTGQWSDRFGEGVLAFEDHDGLCLELVATRDASHREGWPGGPVPAARTVRFIRGATLLVRQREPSTRFLTDLFGLTVAIEDGERTRLVFPDDDAGVHIDVLGASTGPEALPVPLEGVLPEAGTINQLAIGPVTSDEQRSLRRRLLAAGFQATGVKDRRYFQSIYTLDPAGVRLEAATGEPGFLVDEPRDRLGTTLQLPPWLESRRGEYERLLPPLSFNS